MIAQMFRRSAAALVVTLALAGASARADDAKLPKTAEDHVALAKRYEDKAAEYRQEAAYHRDMAAAYRAYLPEFRNHPIRGEEPEKMQKHCMAIMKDTEKLATEAEAAAKYHRLRAKEMAGK